MLKPSSHCVPKGVLRVSMHQAIRLETFLSWKMRLPACACGSIGGRERRWGNQFECRSVHIIFEEDEEVAKQESATRVMAVSKRTVSPDRRPHNTPTELLLCETCAWT